jgi:hypothetical protein
MVNDLSLGQDAIAIRPADPRSYMMNSPDRYRVMKSARRLLRESERPADSDRGPRHCLIEHREADTAVHKLRGTGEAIVEREVGDNLFSFEIMMKRDA